MQHFFALFENSKVTLLYHIYEICQVKFFRTYLMNPSAKLIVKSLRYLGLIIDAVMKGIATAENTNQTIAPKTGFLDTILSASSCRVIPAAGRNNVYVDISAPDTAYAAYKVIQSIIIKLTVIKYIIYRTSHWPLLY